MKREQSSEYIRRREKIHKFYKSSAWIKTREIALKRDLYICQDCGKPAEHVHHIIRLSEANVGNPAVSLNLDNLVSLCHRCHDHRHKGEQGKGRRFEEENPYQYTFDSNGMLIPK